MGIAGYADIRALLECDVVVLVEDIPSFAIGVVEAVTPELRIAICLEIGVGHSPFDVIDFTTVHF